MKINKVIESVGAFAAAKDDLSYSTVDASVFLNYEVLNFTTTYPPLFYNGSAFLYESSTKKNYKINVATRTIETLTIAEVPISADIFLNDFFLSNEFFIQDGKLMNSYMLYSISQKRRGKLLQLPHSYLFFLKISESKALFKSEDDFIIYDLENNEINRQFTLNTLGTYVVPVGGGEPQGEEAVKTKSVVGYSNGVLINSTNSEWLIGIEIETGHLLWTLKGIKEVYPYQQFYKWDKFYSTAPIKVDQERGVIYCFDHNVYWEWDIQTQKLIKLVHKFEEAQQGFYDHSGHRYEIVGDTIYYAYGGSISKFNGREAWPKLIGVSKDTGEIVEQLEFKKKKGEKPIYGWNDFQYADGKFYLLDNNGVLRVIEK